MVPPLTPFDLGILFAFGSKAPDFKSELLANDKSDTEIFFSSYSPLIRISGKIIFAEPVVANKDVYRRMNFGQMVILQCDFAKTL